ALPSEICSRMKKAAGKVMSSVEFNNSAFNIEFLWDEETDRLKLLEINPRIAQSHADLFEKVDGCSNHRIILDIARGRRPEMPFREGPCNVAGKFFVRHFKNGIVKSAPGEQDVRRLKDAIPGIHVSLRAEEGRELAELDYQDSYSYKLAILYFGGDSPEDLQDKFELAKDILGYQIEDF
ncbi:MAG TPA: hypothetical protein VJ904_14165, partial [Tichowtungia sp.]|nr:hypothetical protein [Tichowtungia sp.]